MSETEQASDGLTWLDPPGDPIAIDTATSPVSLAGVGSGWVPDSSTDEIRLPSFAVYFVEDSPAKREAALAICPDMAGFLVLPMFVADATDDQVSRLGELEGVIVHRVGPTLASLVPIVRGIDFMAAVETSSSMPAPPLYPVGGTIAGDGKYPTLVERPGRLDFVPDPSLRLDTRPARMPVINLSLEPPTADWRVDDLDPVNVATRLVAQSQLCVFAIGNQDRKRLGREKTSPWAEVPWVLGVGATSDPEGTTLADISSTGLPDFPESGPDLVAWGASDLDLSKVATSYAAPRVSEAAGLCASAIEQLAHIAGRSEGGRSGVPLVGYGWIDSGYRLERIWPRAPLLAQPAVGVDQEGLARSLAACKEAGIPLDLSVHPERLRRMVISAARPIPNAAPHEVGAGFLSPELLVEWLARWTTKHFAWYFAAEAPSSRSFDLLPDAPIFAGPAELVKLRHVLRASAPMWIWDFSSSMFALRPELPPQS